MVNVFVHGVPDTPAMWGTVIEALGPDVGECITPAMPGFSTPLPSGFKATKEAYLDWLIATLEDVADRQGPANVVGHDWGAALTVRAAHLRPELFRTWTAIDAVPRPKYRWHKNARIWQTPVLGELSMLMMRGPALENALVQAGMPRDLVSIEAPKIDGTMKKAILKLYRSAVTMGEDWGTDLTGLPRQGLVIWGERDPFVPVKGARVFAEEHGIPIHVESGAGHWVQNERPEPVACRIAGHWAAA